MRSSGLLTDARVTQRHHSKALCCLELSILVTTQNLHPWSPLQRLQETLPLQIRILLLTYKYFCSITWGRDFLSLLTFWSFQSPVFTSWALWMFLFRGNSCIRDRREKKQKSRKTKGEKHDPLKPISRGRQEQRGVCFHFPLPPRVNTLLNVRSQLRPFFLLSPSPAAIDHISLIWSLCSYCHHCGGSNCPVIKGCSLAVM